MVQKKKKNENSRVYGKNRKGDISDDRLFHNTNRQSKKVMVSACIMWYRATKTFFVNNKGLKVNTKRYKTHLEKELLPNIESMMKRKEWIFLQDSAASNRANLVQDFLLEKLNKRFVKYSEWPPTSPDCNPPDYYFWEKVQRKVYENRFNRPFENENALMRRIRRVWPEVSRDIEEIRRALKEFVPRLKSVNEKDGQCIKMLFG